MLILTILLSIIAILICGLVVWSIGKLNKYIGKLENQIENQLDRIDELEELLVQSNIKTKKIIRKSLMPEEDDQ